MHIIFIKFLILIRSIFFSFYNNLLNAIKWYYKGSIMNTYLITGVEFSEAFFEIFLQRNIESRNLLMSSAQEEGD